VACGGSIPALSTDERKTPKEREKDGFWSGRIPGPSSVTESKPGLDKRLTIALFYLKLF